MLTAIVPVSGMAGRLDHLEKWLPTIVHLDIQIVIVHDHRDDETEIQLLAILGAINSSKIVFLSGTFGSPGAARNAGLERVDSEYVCFWDSDDLPYPQAVLSEIEIHSGDFDILVGQYVFSFNDSKDIQHDKAKDFSLRDVAINPGLWRVVFRRDFIMAVKFKKMRMGEDQLFLAEIMTFKPRVSFSSTVFYNYFVGHPAQLTQSPTAIAELSYAFTEMLALREKTSRREFEFTSIMISRMTLTLAKFAIHNNAKYLTFRSIFSSNNLITRHPVLQIKSAFFVILHLARSVKHA
jgi:glycosyltransferase involved in cell wall biosynthesis